MQRDERFALVNVLEEMRDPLGSNDRTERVVEPRLAH
jgi:hypothetical protein